MLHWIYEGNDLIGLGFVQGEAPFLRVSPCYSIRKYSNFIFQSHKHTTAPFDEEAHTYSVKAHEVGSGFYFSELHACAIAVVSGEAPYMKVEMVNFSPNSQDRELKPGRGSEFHNHYRRIQLQFNP